MPMTLWSVEKTYLRQKPNSSWGTSWAARWGVSLVVGCMTLSFVFAGVSPGSEKFLPPQGFEWRKFALAFIQCPRPMQCSVGLVPYHQTEPQRQINDGGIKK